MRAPALALAWQFRRQHRWGVIVVGVYFVVLALIRLIGPRFDFSHEPTFALVVVVPMTAAFFYFLAVFSFGLGGDVAARQSVYPPRMFTMPLTNGALAGWPMLYGALAMAVLWGGTRLLGSWPEGVPVPRFWPLLLGPALLAWTQALTWMPYPLRGLRVAVIVLWLTAINAVVMTALELQASEAVMLALLAPQVPLAFVVARWAVGRARCGTGTGPHPAPLRSATRAGRQKAEAWSPARAQLWLEWREHGRSLPLLVAILLPFELAMLVAFASTPAIVYEMLVLVLLTPPLMAVFVAATVSRGVTPFVVTRPVDDASLVAAKLKATLASTLLAWLLIAIALPVALRWSGTAALAGDVIRGVVEAFGVPRAIVLGVLLAVALVGATWKQLVQSLCIGMTGREWLIKSIVFAALLLMTIALPLVDWILHSRVAAAWAWNRLPLIAAVLAVAKLAAAAWIVTRLRIDGRTIVAGAALWCVAVFAIYGLLVWIFPQFLFPSSFLGLVAILMVPLARLSAAPLALAWSRHR